MRWICLTLAFAAPLAAELEAEARAILTRRCLGCHGAQTRMGGLDLSTRAMAVRGGARGPALRLEAPTQSLLLARITQGQMPPSAPLPAGEQETLQRWLTAGAPWKEKLVVARAGLDWWAFQPLRIQEAPPSDWSRAPIDRWIHA